MPAFPSSEHPSALTHTSTNLRRHTTGGAVYQYFHQAFVARVCRMVLDAAPRTVLDAGCGEGFVTAALARRAAHVELTGIDADAEAVAFARAHFGEQARFETGTVYALPFEDDAFDTVLCSEVLEHVRDPDRAMAELCRVARRHVVVTVPREPYFHWLNALGRRLGLDDDPGHVNFWTHAGFASFVRRHVAAPRFATKHLYRLAVGRPARRHV